MMKIGCMDLSYNDDLTSGKLNLEGFIERAYSLGLDGIEIHSKNLLSDEPKYLWDLRLKAMRRGLPIGYIGISNDFGKPADEIPAEIAKVKHVVDIASFMAVPLVRVFAAWLRTGEPEDVIWKRLIPSLQEAAAYGEEKGVVIGLQNHNHKNVTKTGRDVLRIIEEVGSSYLSHILDTGQYIGSPGAPVPGEDRTGDQAPANEDVYNSIKETAPLAVYVRTKFYRVMSGEEVWLDYPRIIGILKDAGYNGFVSVVYEGWQAEPSETAVPKAVGQLKKILGRS